MRRPGKRRLSRLQTVETSPTVAYAAEYYPNIASISSPPPFLTFFFFLTAFPSFAEPFPPSVSSACRGRFSGLVVTGSADWTTGSGEGGRENRRSEDDAGVAERDEGALGAGDGFALRFAA